VSDVTGLPRQDGSIHAQSTDGVTIALHDLGGDGAPVLLCHATGFCGRAYEPLAAELRHRHHVWALDFRAHGDSTAPAGGRFDWAGMADDLLAAIDAVTGDPVALVGHSMGGAAILLVEVRRPGTVRWAHVFEPIVPPDGELPPGAGGENPMGAAARRRHATFPSRANALERYAGRPPLGELRADSLWCYVEHGFADRPDGTVELKCTPEHEAATFEADGKPTVDVLGRIEAPVVVAVGTTARGWSPALFGPAVAAALPNGRLERHPTLGHFGPLQDPSGMAASILTAAAAFEPA
jgi:pimeloyl-ACP methyl ester carboxylesterase